MFVNGLTEDHMFDGISNFLNSFIHTKGSWIQLISISPKSSLHNEHVVFFKEVTIMTYLSMNQALID